MNQKPQKLTEQQIVDMLKPMRERADQRARELSDQREQFRREFRCEPYGNERPGWSGSVHPTIFSAVEWLKPGLMDVFTGDFFTFTPKLKDGEDVRERGKTAVKLQKYVANKLFVEQDGEQAIEDYIHDGLLYHFGVMKVTQREDFEISPEPFVGPLDHAADMMAADQSVIDITVHEQVDVPDPLSGTAVTIAAGTILRRTPTYSGPLMEVIPGDEFRYVPGYRSLDVNPMVAHVVKRDLDYILRQEKAGKFLPGSAERVREGIGTDSQDDAATRQEVQARDTGLGFTSTAELDFDTEANGDGMAANNKRVSVWECYVRLDLYGTGLLIPSIVVLAGDVVLAGPVENPYGSPPFVLWSAYDEPHQIEGRGFADILSQRQKVLTNLWRGIQDAAALSTYRGYLTTDQQTKKVLAGMGPGDVGMVPQLNQIQQLDHGSPGQFIFEATQFQMQEVSKESGVNENMQGLDNNAINKTAAGMNMRMSAGMQKQKHIARHLARAMRQILGRVLDIIRLYPPKDDVVLLGSDLTLSPQDFQGRYSVAIDVGVGPQEKQAKAAAYDMYIEFALQNGPAFGILPEQIIAAIKAKYDTLDMDMSEYLPAPEQMQTVMAMQQQLMGLQQENAMMRQDMQTVLNGPGGIPRQMLGQAPPPALPMGMPLMGGPRG